MTRRFVILTRLCLVTLLSVSVSGCSQWYYEFGETLAGRALPESGSQATLKEVLELLGPPHRISSAPSGYLMSWEFWRVQEASFGFNFGAQGIDFMSADFATVDTQGEFLLLTFDRNYVLSTAKYSSWDNRLGGGQAFQPFGAVDLVATSDLVAGYPQHFFGANLLRRLPEALNAGSDLDAGGNGLEQRGTPDNIGQRALEMQ